MKPKYGDKIKLLFTDTDSLCYEIETEDVYKDMREMVDLLDTSNYAEDHPLFSIKYKKMPGKFKDELGGKYYVSNIVITQVYSRNIASIQSYI